MTTTKTSAPRVRQHRQSLRDTGSVRFEVSLGADVVADIKALAMEKLGIELPPVIVAAVEHDIVDTRMGLGAEVNRRFKQYMISAESDGYEPGILPASITRAGDKFQVVGEMST